ncbi:hypothetical protein ASE31_13200 [Acidovorax sp. Root217]|nr:hypothetical protein ASE31_13200 [Acidovorax sp. Root217]
MIWSGPYEKETLAVLGDTEVCCIQHLVRQQYFVSCTCKSLDELFEKTNVFAKSQTSDVLEYKVLGIQLSNQSHIVKDQLIARIIQRTLSDQGKALARSAPENYINVSFSEASDTSNVCS